MNENNISKNENLKGNPPLGSDAYNNIIVPKTRKRPILSAFDIAAFFGVFVLTFLLIDYVVFCEFTFLTTIVYLAIFALATAFIVSKQKKFPKAAIAPGLLAIVTSFTFSLHGNYELNAAAFILLIYLSGSYCIKLTESGRHSDGSYFYLLDVIKCEVLLPIKNIFLPLLSLGTLKKDKTQKDKKQSRKALGIVCGMLLAIPVLLVVIPLLLRGDAAFESVVGSAAEAISKWFEAVFSKLFGRLENSFDGIVLFPTFIFAPYIYSVMFSFRHGVSNEENKDTSNRYKVLRFASPNLIGGFLGVISLVYVVYLLTQLSYFFSAFAGHLPGGAEISVAEYARRGFFEMTQIAGVNFAIIAVSILFAKRKENGKLSGIVKWFDLFLCVFTILLISTSISKIAFYIGSYGLTHKRIYVFVFDVVLIFVFLSVIIRLFKEKFPYMKIILTVSCLAVASLSLIGVDAAVAKNNVDLYLSGKTDVIDVSEIRNLCPAGIESLDRLAQCKDKQTSEDAKNSIADLLGDNNIRTELSGYDRITYTLEDLKAQKYFEKNRERLTLYFNEYYALSSYQGMYITLDTKTKIKNIDVTDGYDLYTVPEAPKYGNNELIKVFYNSIGTIPEEYEKVFDDNNAEKWDNILIAVTDESGKESYLFPEFRKDYQRPILVKICEENGSLTVQSVSFDDSMTYNHAVSLMEKERADVK